MPSFISQLHSFSWFSKSGDFRIHSGKVTWGGTNIASDAAAMLCDAGISRDHTQLLEQGLLETTEWLLPDNGDQIPSRTSDTTCRWFYILSNAAMRCLDR